MYLGPDSLRKVVENAELYPIKGLFKFRDFVHEIDEYYNQRSIEHLGVSTGWKTLDGLYNVRILLDYSWDLFLIYFKTKMLTFPFLSLI